jgi:hypothetical protein
MKDVAAAFLRRRTRHVFQTMRWLVDDLTDDEYFWEPVSDCWSVRRRGEATVDAWGTGDWVCEDTWPPPDPPPVTTIACIVHLAAWTDIYRDWTWAEGRPRLRDLEVPGTAAGAVAWLIRSQDGFAAEGDKLTDADLLERRPAHYGGLVTVDWLVSSMLTEHTHHGAEIGVLRDLRRGHARLQAPELEDPPL